MVALSRFLSTLQADLYEVYSRTKPIILQNWISLILIGLAIQVPMSVFAGLTVYAFGKPVLAYGAYYASRLNTLEVTLEYLASLGLSALIRGTVGFWAALLLVLIVQIYVVTKLVSCAGTYLALQAQQTSRVSPWMAYRFPRYTFGRVVLAGLIESLLAFGPALLVFIAMLWLGASPFISVVVAGTLMIVSLFSVTLLAQITIQAIVIEEVGPIRGLLTSARLLATKIPLLLSVVILLALVNSVLSYPIQVWQTGMLQIIAFQLGNPGPYLALFFVLFFLSSDIGYALWLPLQAVTYAMLYQYLAGSIRE